MKKLILGFVVLFNLINLYAWEKEFYISVEPVYQLNNETFSEKITKNGNTYSEIEWPNKSESMLGARVGAGWRFINLDCGILFGIPAEKEKMNESDYINKTDPSVKTIYFECDNEMKSHFELQTKLLFEIPIINILRVNPYAGFNYGTLKYNASNRIGKNGNTPAVAYDNPQAKDYNGTGSQIDYERQIYDFVLGVQAGVFLFNRLSLLADFNFSPFYMVNSKEEYLFSKGHYLESMKGSFCKLGIGAVAECKIWKGLSAGMNFNYSFTGDLKGDYYSSSDGNSYKLQSGYEAITKSSSWQLGIFAKYKFSFGKSYVAKPKKNKNKIEFTRYD